MRPDSMKYFDDFREQNILALEKAKQDKTPVIGTYCGFAPYEMIWAAGAIPVGLCGTSQTPIADAEAILPRNLCPLIKSSFGFSITNSCPFFRFSDFIIAETTCDGKKKMFELLKEYKPLHVMHLPAGADRPSARESWIAELRLLREVLEEQCSSPITDERLWEEIKRCNYQRAVTKSVHELNKFDPAPLSGMDMMKALLLLFFNADREHGLTLSNQLIDEVQQSGGKGFSPFPQGTPRILLTGCPVSIGSDKLVRIVEEVGGSVVCYEMCTGARGFSLVNEDDYTDPIEALADRYLSIPCPCMSPNPGRPELLSELIGDYKVDGIIDITWQACHTFAVEDALLQKINEQEWDLPFLHVETDYSTADVEQLTTRVGAFIDLIK